MDPARQGGTSSSLHLATGSFLFLVAMHRASARTSFSTMATPSKWATSTWSGVERTGVAFVGDLLVRAFDAGGSGEDHLDVLLEANPGLGYTSKRRGQTQTSNTAYHSVPKSI